MTDGATSLIITFANPCPDKNYAVGDTILHGRHKRRKKPETLVEGSGEQKLCRTKALRPEMKIKMTVVSHLV
jgi:hypothetical protein